MRLMTLGLLAAAPVGILLGAGSAKANSLDPTPPALFVTDNGSSIVLSISMAVSAGPPQSQIVSGDRFSLFDVLGPADLAAGSVVEPANWQMDPAEQMATGVILHANPSQDDASDWNIVFEYTGSSPLTGPVGTFSFTLNETLAAFLASLPTPGVVWGGASYELSANPNTQLTNTIGIPVSVPLPSAAGMGLATLAGFAGLGLIRRRRLVIA